MLYLLVDSALRHCGSNVQKLLKIKSFQVFICHAMICNGLKEYKIPASNIFVLSHPKYERVTNHYFSNFL